MSNDIVVVFLRAKTGKVGHANLQRDKVWKSKSCESNLCAWSLIKTSNEERHKGIQHFIHYQSA